MTDIWPYLTGALILSGIIHLVPFLVALIRRNKETGGKIALAYLGLSLLWGVAIALADLDPVFIDPLSQAVGLFVPLITCALAVTQLVLVCALLEIGLLTYFGGGGVLALTFLLVVDIHALIDPPSPLPLDQIARGMWAAAALILIAVTTLALFRSRLALHRNRALYWMVAAVLLTGAQAWVLLPVGPLRAFGLLPHSLGAIALARGALSYWLPNVKAMLRGTLRFLLLLAVTAALLFAVAIGAEQLADRITLSHTVLLIALAVLAALIYLPLYNLLQKLVDRILEGVGFDPASALRDYSQTISTILDLEQLATTVAQTVAQVFDVRRAALLVTTKTERGGMQLQPVPGLGEIPQEPIELEPISPIRAHLESADAPLFQYEIEHNPTLREAAAQERKWLRDLEMEVYLPIRSQGQLSGLLALGPQGTGEPYSLRAIQFLTTMAHQTGVALQNASLFEGLRALNARITQLNENLRAAYERLERLDKAKTDFLSIASHELRTPLTQVRGYVDVLTELSSSGTLAPKQIQRIAGNISAPIRRLENILNAMLDASRIDTEGLSLNFVPTSLVLIMRMAVENWAMALKERKITLQVSGVDQIPPIVADGQRLYQAFSNLLSNAIKYTPDGGKITVEARPLDDEHFQVTFSDTGIGIAKADQELIFEKFYRVGSVSLHSSGDSKFKGAGPGLGLPIARGVIEGHGGKIWVESPGYDEATCPGSTFYVVLPYKAHRGPCRWQPPAVGAPELVDTDEEETAD